MTINENARKTALAETVALELRLGPLQGDQLAEAVADLAGSPGWLTRLLRLRYSDPVVWARLAPVLEALEVPVEVQLRPDAPAPVDVRIGVEHRTLGDAVERYRRVLPGQSITLPPRWALPLLRARCRPAAHPTRWDEGADFAADDCVEVGA
jgi:hypothetical protein